MTVSRRCTRRARCIPTKVPDFFIVGHPKSGTTALYEMLRRHPQIYMPALKEPEFFAERDAASARGRQCLPGHARGVSRAVRGARARPARRRGIAVLSRIAHGGGEIAALQPQRASSRSCASRRASCARFTCSCSRRDRDGARPAQGARAGARQAARAGAAASRLLAAGAAVLEHVRYVEQLRRYHAEFPPEQVLVLIYDDFRADNEGDRARGAALPGG